MWRIHGQSEFVTCLLGWIICSCPAAVCSHFLCVQNRVGHLKNHAFLMVAAGGWWLAPAYDVTGSFGPGGEHMVTIADKGCRPGRASFEAVALESGISAFRAAEFVDVVDGAVADWMEYADVMGVPPQLRREISEQMERAVGW